MLAPIFSLSLPASLELRKNWGANLEHTHELVLSAFLAAVRALAGPDREAATPVIERPLACLQVETRC